MVENDDTASLVLAARQGQVRAFETLARRHYRAGFAVALAVVGNRADAEDVVQEALVTALTQLEQCREPARFAGWLLRSVRNRALNVLRSRRTSGAALHQLELGRRGEPPPVDTLDLREQLTGALSTLPTRQRELVLLHDLAGWNHAEIAVELEISEVMSRQLLFQARRTLRSVLAGSGAKAG